MVELRGGTYWTVIASSSTPNYFVRGAISGVPRPVPSAAAEELEPATIATNVVCRGPCVLFDPGSGKFYLRVVNTGSTGLVADLYLYGSDLADTNEPGNDSRGGAPALADGAFGAIELLGDVDYWLAPAGANVTVEPVRGAIALEATVYDACGLPVAGPYPGGQTFRVFSGEAVRVRATQERAAAPGRSGYYLSVTSPSGGTPPRDGGCTPVTAGTNPDSPAVSVFMGSNATATFVVSVPSSVRSRDVIQFEVGGSARLEVLGSGGSVLYSSASPDVFFAGGGALAAPSEVEPAAVAVGRVCGGPCVIDPAPASSYLVRVRNQGPARNVPLFAFGRDFDDTTEPANDSRLTAPSLTDDGSGAIEFVGDVDLWYVPFDGTVSRRYVDPGDSAVPGQPVFQIADASEIWVTAQIDDIDVGKVREGQEVEIVLPAYLGRSLPGRITWIAATATPRTEVGIGGRVVRARIDLTGGVGPLRPGMEVDVSAEATLARDVLLVPADAVIEDQTGRWVMTVGGGRTGRREIVLGANNYVQAQVVEGLDEGDAVVVEGKEDVEPGDRVRTRMRERGE